MNIEKVVEYVLQTPHNTNRAILEEMLRQLIIDYGGNPDGPEGPDPDDLHIIYDGGIEE